MLKKIEIFDMDGVLANTHHRTIIDENGLLDLGHWLEHNKPEFVKRDSLDIAAAYYKKCLADPSIYVVICTVRQIQQHDRDWITENLGMPDMLIYPYENVGSKGAQFKAKALQKFNQLRQFAKLPKKFHEDNAKYLTHVCNALSFTGAYYPSGYGAAGVKNVPAWLKTA